MAQTLNQVLCGDMRVVLPEAHIGLTAIQESRLTAYQQLRAERDKLAAENWKLRRGITEECLECDWFDERVEGRCWQKEMTEVIALYEHELMNRQALEQILKAQRNDILRLKKAVAEANAQLEMKLQVRLGL